MYLRPVTSSDEMVNRSKTIEDKHYIQVYVVCYSTKRVSLLIGTSACTIIITSSIITSIFTD